MIRGFYTSLSGLIATIDRAGVVADDIANVGTTGYKASYTTQRDFGLVLSESLDGTIIGELGTATTADGLTMDRAQGPLRQTGLQGDLAIEGDGLFTVRTPDGIAYTRDGTFVLDSTGMLTTEKGYPVLDDQGRTITAPNGLISVGSDGVVQQTGQKLGLVAWPTTGEVTRLGGNLLALPGAPVTAAPTSYRIRQGYLEQSNVDLGAAMTALINVQRSMQMSARALSLQDQTLAEASQLGKLR
jgi:flagellar basal-body rod protein FlgF